MPVTSERMEHDMKEGCWIGRKVGVDGESGVMKKEDEICGSRWSEREKQRQDKQRKNE